MCALCLCEMPFQYPLLSLAALEAQVASQKARIEELSRAKLSARPPSEEAAALEKSQLRGRITGKRPMQARCNMYVHSMRWYAALEAQVASQKARIEELTRLKPSARALTEEAAALEKSLKEQQALKGRITGTAFCLQCCDQMSLDSLVWCRAALEAQAASQKARIEELSRPKLTARPPPAESSAQDKAENEQLRRQITGGFRSLGFHHHVT